jgi:hypothetical protein
MEGDRIIRNAPDRSDLLKAAALKPTLHRELWDYFREKGGIPPDDLLRHYLVWERPEPRFNEKSVGGFIADFRATLKLAKLDAGDIMEVEAGDDPLDNAAPTLGVDDEMSTATIDKPPVERNRPESAIAGTDKAILPLDLGMVTFTWPDGLDKDAVEDLESWLKVVMRRVRRKAGLPPE